jgi:hypothetical protein
MIFGEHFVTTETPYLLRSIPRQGCLVLPGEAVGIAKRGVFCAAVGRAVRKSDL